MLDRYYKIKHLTTNQYYVKDGIWDDKGSRYSSIQSASSAISGILSRGGGILLGKGPKGCEIGPLDLGVAEFLAKETVIFRYNNGSYKPKGLK